MNGGGRAILFAAAIAALFGRPGGAAAQPIPQADIDRAAAQVHGEIGAMAASFGWAGPMPVVEGERLETREDQISLSRSGIADLVRGLAGADLLNAVRLIVAHEVWHFVEIRQGGRIPNAADAEERRIYECRADLMAGRYLTSRIAGWPEPGAAFHSNLQSSAAHRIAGTLWANDARAAQVDYPRVRQRAMAAQFGALTVLRDDPNIAPGDRELVDRMLDFQPGETLRPWSRRACEKLTRFGGQALLSIAASDMTEAYGTDTATFDIEYVNMSRRPVEVSLTIIASYYPTLAAGLRLWHFPQRFTIGPSARHRVRVVVPEVYGRGGLGLLYRPIEDDLPIAARFAGDAVAAEIPILGSALSREELRFALAIQRLANDALNGFAHNRAGGAGRSGSGLFFRSAIDIPTPGGGANSTGTDIMLSNEGAASVHKAFVRNRPRQEGLAIYQATRAAFARIWPAARITDGVGRNNLPQFSAFVTRYARIDVMQDAMDGAVLSVGLTITPNVTGLTEP